MKQPVILIGVGEMGGVFARGLLRLGHPVYPVNRDTDLSGLARQLPDPAMVLVSVGEADLGPDDDALNNLDPRGDTADRDGADDGLHLSDPFCGTAAARGIDAVLPGGTLDERIVLHVCQHRVALRGVENPQDGQIAEFIPIVNQGNGAR